VVACSGHSGRAGVEGDVSFNGKPVERGMVELHPIDGATGPMVGGVIEQGKFRIPAEKGPVIGGAYKVRIVGMEKTGQKQVNRDRPNEISDVYRNVIPAEYNSQSKLKVVISEDQPNRLDYALKRSR
jgi:hypothetical protein